jgi:release factor glutamine methyltransferase
LISLLKSFQPVMRLTVCLLAGWMMKSKPAGQHTVGETFENLCLRLKETSDTSTLDARLLLAHLLDKPRSWVLAHPEAAMSEERLASLEKLVARLEAGEPLPYILGAWEFFGLMFNVNSNVLIPRPETELIVEMAVAWLRNMDRTTREITVLDLGTGSGCIAISLAVNIPRLSITATDISRDALAVAQGNAEKHKVSGCITLIEADLFDNPLIPENFSMILANPPYIPTKVLLKTRVYGREPTLALDGGVDGLVLIRRIIQEIPNRLGPGGLLLMEIESSQGPAVLSLASEAFPNAQVHLHKDYAGNDRLLEVQV